MVLICGQNWEPIKLHASVFLRGSLKTLFIWISRRVALKRQIPSLDSRSGEIVAGGRGGQAYRQVSAPSGCSVLWKCKSPASRALSGFSRPRLGMCIGKRRWQSLRIRVLAHLFGPHAFSLPFWRTALFTPGPAPCHLFCVLPTVIWGVQMTHSSLSLSLSIHKRCAWCGGVRREHQV